MKIPLKRKVIFTGVLFLLLLSFALNLYLLNSEKKISPEDIAVAEKIIGLQFNQKDRELMVDDVNENLINYEKIRNVKLENSVPPSLYFNPIPPGYKIEKTKKKFKISKIKDLKVPENFDDLAFYPLTHLSALIRERKITSLQLTKLYLERLKKFGPKLECVVTLTEDLALEQAKKADEEIAKGKWRGPLHGIPWGVKDLFSTKGYKTTWGTPPYKDQIIDEDATVVKRLKDAGAVLVAKLSLGELAWGDVWFGGKTKNPWNLQQGSSGSSAGSASATSAGLVAFAIGTETWGSIVSPSTRCGVTGLRPTFGRVSRYGAMALSWSMDKVGPICRSVEDCAIVFNYIYGPDGKDPTVFDFPFNWDPDIDVRNLRVGYLKKEFEKDYRNKENDIATLELLRSLGINLIPIELPDLPIESLSIILNVEAASAFDELTRTRGVDMMVRQERRAWPNVFRWARLVPAVEYIQANRIRTLLINEMAERLKNIDVYVSPSFGINLLLTNLTGHPAVVVPNGFDKDGNPTSITFIGNLFKEAEALALAKKYQDSTGFHLKHPKLN
jgi:Asp-tRNA(Asn)/Glu-tRNA(Gln) amidotransferase A subunit family amidase